MSRKGYLCFWLTTVFFKYFSFKKAACQLSEPVLTHSLQVTGDVSTKKEKLGVFSATQNLTKSGFKPWISGIEVKHYQVMQAAEMGLHYAT